jgi:hypothetical protein
MKNVSLITLLLIHAPILLKVRYPHVSQLFPREAVLLSCCFLQPADSFLLICIRLGCSQQQRRQVMLPIRVAMTR